ncbi:MAG: SCP2 sterol-binding domain-containing protein [Deltaproteobacteria bacterium]
MKKRLEALFFKGIKVPLKATPLWMEAIGVGVFIRSVVDANPGFRLRLADVDDKVFLFEAKDIGKKFYLHIKDGGINVVPHTRRPPDVTMSGKVEVLVNVLIGRVDPDTVFFSRKLEITGDTSTAIRFKNMLAALA